MVLDSCPHIYGNNRWGGMSSSNSWCVCCSLFPETRVKIGKSNVQSSLYTKKGNATSKRIWINKRWVHKWEWYNERLIKRLEWLRCGASPEDGCEICCRSLNYSPSPATVVSLWIRSNLTSYNYNRHQMMEFLLCYQVMNFWLATNCLRKRHPRKGKLNMDGFGYTKERWRRFLGLNPCVTWNIV